PTQPEVPSFVLQIEEISGASGVTQLSIQPGDAGPPEGGGNFSRVPITMTFEGTYEQLQDFMVRIQNLVRLVGVNEVSYETAEQGGGATTVDPGIERILQVEILAEIYFQPGDVPSGQAPVAPAPEGVTTPQEGTTGAQ
ncbi:MAG: type 4a pilus biogenesis protein PilO, partial [Rubrobacteraceae bacterium]